MAGFSNADSQSSSFGRIPPALTCFPAPVLCKDRSKYVCWDEYHPSNSANELIAKEIIKKFGFSRIDETNGPFPAPAIASSPESANELIAKGIIKKFGFSRIDETDGPFPAPAIASSPDSANELIAKEIIKKFGFCELEYISKLS